MSALESHSIPGIFLSRTSLFIIGQPGYLSIACYTTPGIHPRIETKPIVRQAVSFQAVFLKSREADLR